jgi:hypothetical protein
MLLFNMQEAIFQKTTLFYPQSTPSAEKLPIPKAVASKKWLRWIGWTVCAKQICISRTNKRRKTTQARKGLHYKKYRHEIRHCWIK